MIQFEGWPTEGISCLIFKSGQKLVTGVIRGHRKTYWYFALGSCCQTIFLTFMFVDIYLCCSQLWSEKFPVAVGRN